MRAERVLTPLRDVQLRAGSPQDWTDCLRIWRSATARAHPFLSLAERDRQSVVVTSDFLPRARLALAVHADHPFWFAAWFDESSVAELGGLFIEPSWQGQGWGARLLRSSAPAALPVRVRVYAGNIGARRFYERLGFRCCADPSPAADDAILTYLAAARVLAPRPPGFMTPSDSDMA